MRAPQYSIRCQDTRHARFVCGRLSTGEPCTNERNLADQVNILRTLTIVCDPEKFLNDFLPPSETFSRNSVLWLFLLFFTYKIICGVRRVGILRLFCLIRFMLFLLGTIVLRFFCLVVFLQFRCPFILFTISKEFTGPYSTSTFKPLYRYCRRGARLQCH